jgi:carotenoid cleavage dioxygenase-like enzyme
MAVISRPNTNSFLVNIAIYVFIFAISWRFAITNLPCVFFLSDLINIFHTYTIPLRNAENPYLNGGFAPVSIEHLNISMEVLSGSIPSSLFNGLSLRIGPNPFAHHNTRHYHWFDGHGMIHSIRFLPGNPSSPNPNQPIALYSNQWIETKRFKLEKQYDRNIFFQFGESIGLVGLIKAILVSPLISNVLDVPELKAGQANTDLLYYNKHLYALHEGSLPFEIKWKENNHFQSIGYENHFSLAGSGLNRAVTAHPKSDLHDGKLYFNGYNPRPGFDALQHGTLNNRSLETYYGVEMKSGKDYRPWVHDFMVTEHYVLLIESSIQMFPKGIMDGEIFKLFSDRPLRIGINLKNATSADQAVWFTADRSYGTIHMLQAWEEINEENEKLVKLAAPLATSFDITLAGKNEYFMHVISMNLATGRMTVNRIDETNSVEFPRAHPLCVGGFCRYGFSSAFKLNKIHDPYFGGTSTVHPVCCCCCCCCCCF